MSLCRYRGRELLEPRRRHHRGVGQRGRPQREGGLHPGRVAKAIEHALTARRPKGRYLIGHRARLMVGASSVLPARVYDAVVERTVGLPRKPPTSDWAEALFEWLTAAVATLEPVPVGDFVLTQLPAQVDLLALEKGRKVDQPAIDVADDDSGVI